MKKQQAGFTLIEISIVLVIISLLLGGVLKGQELIQNTKLKSVVTDSKGLAAAIYTYQDRYKAYPGDDPACAAHLPIGAVCTNGNGNGAVTTAGEKKQLFNHLRLAGLLTGNGAVFPSPALGRTLEVEWSPNDLSGHATCFRDVDVEAAKLLDLMNDDGVPNTGSVRSNRANYTTAGQTHFLCFSI